jgi:hypothetical protein
MAAFASDCRPQGTSVIYFFSNSPFKPGDDDSGLERTENREASNKSFPDEMLAEGCCFFRLSNKPLALLKSGIPLAQEIPAPVMPLYI